MGIVSDRAANGFAVTDDYGKHVEPTTVIKFVANHDSSGNPRVMFVGYSGAQVVAIRDGNYASDPYWARSHKVYAGTVECTVSQYNQFIITIDNAIGEWLIRSTDDNKFIYAKTTSKAKANRLMAKEWTAFNVEVVKGDRLLTYHSVVDAE